LIKHQESFNAFVLLTTDDQDLICYILLRSCYEYFYLCNLLIL